MKKILISSLFIFVFIFTMTLSAIAEETPTPTTPAPVVISPTTLACVKTTVEKRETAILATVDVYTASIKKSFEARKNALLSAWNIAKTKERNIAIKNAFAQNRKAKRDAARIYKKSRLAAWQQFTKARIACKAQPTGEDMSVDANFND